MDRKALHNITYGLYLLTAREMGRDNGCIINTAVQVANNPSRIAISVIQQNLTHHMIKETGAFNLSAITESAPFSLFQRFGMRSGRLTDKFSGFSGAERSENTLLYLTEHANMYLSALVTQEIDLGSHTMFIAEVVDGKVLSTEDSCTYGYYQSNIKSQPQKKAVEQWVCTVCGYVYEGGTIPDDYLCPLCFHPKEDFRPV